MNRTSYRICCWSSAGKQKRLSRHLNTVSSSLRLSLLVHLGSNDPYQAGLVCALTAARP